MSFSKNDMVINRTRQWITEVVIGCNFCPFAQREVTKGSIHYEIIQSADEKTILDNVLKILGQLDGDKEIETSLLILSDCYSDFSEYLTLLGKTEHLLIKNKYEGVYQVASFHPEYLFAGTTQDAPSNYTNRSPYPMLHFLREDSVTKAIESYPDIESVPERNIAFTNEKGLAYMKMLLKNC